MKYQLKKMILLCDEAVRCKSLTSFITEKIEVAKLDIAGSLNKLSLLIKEKIPDVILIHTIKAKNNPTSIISKLRSKRKLDATPVVVYKAPLVEEGFTKLQEMLRSIATGSNLGMPLSVVM